LAIGVSRGGVALHERTRNIVRAIAWLGLAIVTRAAVAVLARRLPISVPRLRLRRSGPARGPGALRARALRLRRTATAGIAGAGA
jgi:hypothetical protein